MKYANAYSFSISEITVTVSINAASFSNSRIGIASFDCNCCLVVGFTDWKQIRFSIFFWNFSWHQKSLKIHCEKKIVKCYYLLRVRTYNFFRLYRKFAMFQFHHFCRLRRHIDSILIHLISKLLVSKSSHSNSKYKMIDWWRQVVGKSFKLLISVKLLPWSTKNQYFLRHFAKTFLRKVWRTEI